MHVKIFKIVKIQRNEYFRHLNFVAASSVSFSTSALLTFGAGSFCVCCCPVHRRAFSSIRSTGHHSTHPPSLQSWLQILPNVFWEVKLTPLQNYCSCSIYVFISQSLAWPGEQRSRFFEVTTSFSFKNLKLPLTHNEELGSVTHYLLTRFINSTATVSK